MADAKVPSGPGGKCPICARDSDTHYRPFCSRRCADIDLSRWLSGTYAIPDEAEDEDGADDGSGSNLPRAEDDVPAPLPEPSGRGAARRRRPN